MYYVTFYQRIFQNKAQVMIYFHTFRGMFNKGTESQMCFQNIEFYVEQFEHEIDSDNIFHSGVLLI